MVKRRMVKKLFLIIFIVKSSFCLEYSDQKPSEQHRENSKVCSNGWCAATSYWDGLIKLSCDHYFCGKHAQKSATEKKGKCAFCNKVMFDFSNIPTSLSYELLIPERDEEKRPKPQSAFGALIQDAFKVMMPENPLVQAAPDAQQMFLALGLQRRYRIGDFYQEEPEDRSFSLERAQVINDFWRNLEHAAPEVKEEAVKQLNSDMKFNDTYHWWRARIAAATHIAANVDVCEKSTNRGGYVSYDSPLMRALKQSDEPLIDLLLSKNVSVQTPNILWFAYNKRIAQKLVDRGADITKRWQYDESGILSNEKSIFESVIQSEEYDADLVVFYKEKGLSTTAYQDGLTPLHCLILFHEPAGVLPVIAKFDALVKGMSCQGILDLLASKTKTHFLTCPYDKTVLEILEDRGYYKAKSNFEKVIIYCYLLKVRDDATKLLESSSCKVVQQA
jgi:hypothetical protein